MAEVDEKPKRRARWPFLFAALVLFGFVGTVLAIVLTPSPNVWTDDAYVEVHTTAVAPQIAGRLVAVPVDDNQTVTAGQLLVQLDDRDQRTALAQAEATLARDRAQFADAIATVARQPSIISQQSAHSLSIEAELGLAVANRDRYRNLARAGAGTVQSRQTAEATVAQEQAELSGARASTAAAQHQLDVLRAQVDADQATIAADVAAVQQAQLNLSYTRVLAPLRGAVTERSVQVGDYVTPGGTAMLLVPLDRIYIIANYREVALRHVLPGQHVSIHVDAYNIRLDGVVQGVAPATGAIYSPVPSENATGNFTKIVQRLPVKILVSPGQKLAGLLLAGFSVETTIDTGLADVVEAQEHSSARVTGAN